MFYYFQCNFGARPLMQFKMCRWFTTMSPTQIFQMCFCHESKHTHTHITYTRHAHRVIHWHACCSLCLNCMRMRVLSFRSTLDSPVVLVHVTHTHSHSHRHSQSYTRSWSATLLAEVLYLSYTARDRDREAKPRSKAKDRDGDRDRARKRDRGRQQAASGSTGQGWQSARIQREVVCNTAT